MTEQTAYVILGIIGYFLVYIIVACSTAIIWKTWAWRRFGEFWEYILGKGIKMYYPGIFNFMYEHNFLYSIVYIAFWPIVVPVQTVMNTKVMKKVMSKEYWY